MPPSERFKFFCSLASIAFSMLACGFVWHRTDGDFAHGMLFGLVGFVVLDRFVFTLPRRRVGE